MGISNRRGKEKREGWDGEINSWDLGKRNSIP